MREKKTWMLVGTCFALALYAAALGGCEPERRVVGPDTAAPAPPPSPAHEIAPGADSGPPADAPPPTTTPPPLDDRRRNDVGPYSDPTLDGGLPAEPITPKCGCSAGERCVIYAIANAPDYGGQNFNLFHACVALPASCGLNACRGCADLVCGAMTPDGGGLPQCQMFGADDPWWCKGGLWEASRCDGHYSCRTF